MRRFCDSFEPNSAVAFGWNNYESVKELIAALPQTSAPRAERKCRNGFLPSVKSAAIPALSTFHSFCSRLSSRAKLRWSEVEDYPVIHDGRPVVMAVGPTGAGKTFLLRKSSSFRLGGILRVFW